MRDVTGWLGWVAMPLWVLACVVWASGAQASQFGCRGLEKHKDTPVLEGKNGVFYRIQSDLRMDHRISQRAISDLAELSQALAAQGTLLVYLPVPTKALAMPDNLPPESALYGYDAGVAAQVFQDLIARLVAAGVVAVNAVPQMQDLPPDTPPFFAADFHWTSFGARAAAEAVAARLQREPAYQALEKSTYVSRPLGQETAFSGLRRLLQLSCHKALPQVVTTAFETKKVDQPEAGVLDLFSGDEADQITLVGTSFSDSEINNFAGFLSESIGLDVINRALTGGNQFGAIQDYLTSADFHQNPPAILIWENPVYNSLTRFADQPMRELIAAVQGGCDKQLAPVAQDPLQVALPVGVDPQQTVLVDVGRSSVRRVVLEFETPEGVLRHKSITRSPRQTPTGRFFVPLTGLGPAPKGRIQVQAKSAEPSSIRVFLCPSGKGDI